VPAPLALGIAQQRQLLADRRLRLSGDGGALEQQAVDAFAQRAHRPAGLDAQLGVEGAARGVVDLDQLEEVRPAQLLRQRRNDLLVGQAVEEPGHARQPRMAEAAAVVARQAPGQGLQHASAIIPPCPPASRTPYAYA